MNSWRVRWSIWSESSKKNRNSIVKTSNIATVPSSVYNNPYAKSSSMSNNGNIDVEKTGHSGNTSRIPTNIGPNTVTEIGVSRSNHSCRVNFLNCAITPVRRTARPGSNVELETMRFTELNRITVSDNL